MNNKIGFDIFAQNAGKTAPPAIPSHELDAPPVGDDLEAPPVDDELDAPTVDDSEKSQAPVSHVPAAPDKQKSYPHPSIYGGRLQSVLEMQKALAALAQTIENKDQGEDGYILNYFIANYAGEKYPYKARLVDYETKLNDTHIDKEVTVRDVREMFSQTGTTKTFKNLDGIWGPRTQAAVLNSGIFAKTILELGALANFTSPFFTNSDLQQLNELIPQNENVSANQKNKIAPAIERLVNNLNKYLIELFTHMKSVLTPEARKVSTKLTSQHSDDVKDLISQYGNMQLTAKNLSIAAKDGNKFILPEFKFTLNDLIDSKTIINKIVSSFESQYPKLDSQYVSSNLQKDMPSVLEQLYVSAYSSILMAHPEAT